jgi:hypothetical protein
LPFYVYFFLTFIHSHLPLIMFLSGKEVHEPFIQIWTQWVILLCGTVKWIAWPLWYSHYFHFNNTLLNVIVLIFITKNLYF